MLSENEKRLVGYLVLRPISLVGWLASLVEIPPGLVVAFFVVIPLGAGCVAGFFAPRVLLVVVPETLLSDGAAGRLLPGSGAVVSVSVSVSGSAGGSAGAGVLGLRPLSISDEEAGARAGARPDDLFGARPSLELGDLEPDEAE